MAAGWAMTVKYAYKKWRRLFMKLEDPILRLFAEKKGINLVYQRTATQQEQKKERKKTTLNIKEKGGDLDWVSLLFPGFLEGSRNFIFRSQKKGVSSGERYSSFFFRPVRSRRLGILQMTINLDDQIERIEKKINRWSSNSSSADREGENPIQSVPFESTVGDMSRLHFQLIVWHMQIAWNVECEKKSITSTGT